MSERDGKNTSIKVVASAYSHSIITYLCLRYLSFELYLYIMRRDFAARTDHACLVLLVVGLT